MKENLEKWAEWLQKRKITTTKISAEADFINTYSAYGSQLIAQCKTFTVDDNGKQFGNIRKFYSIVASLCNQCDLDEQEDAIITIARDTIIFQFLWMKAKGESLPDLNKLDVLTLLFRDVEKAENKDSLFMFIKNTTEAPYWDRVKTDITSSWNALYPSAVATMNLSSSSSGVATVGVFRPTVPPQRRVSQFIVDDPQARARELQAKHKENAEKAACVIIEKLRLMTAEHINELRSEKITDVFNLMLSRIRDLSKTEAEDTQYTFMKETLTTSEQSVRTALEAFPLWNELKLVKGVTSYCELGNRTVDPKWTRNGHQSWSLNNTNTVGSSSSLDSLRTTSNGFK